MSFPVRFRPSSARGYLVVGRDRPIAGDPVLHRQFQSAGSREVAAHLLAVGSELENHPHRGRPVPGTEMRELVTNYPYIMRHRIVGNTVRILRVRPTSRRPTNP